MTSTNSHVADWVAGSIAHLTGLAAEDVNQGHEMTDDLGMDSIDIMELVVGAEDEFAIELTDSAVATIRTVAGFVEAIHHARANP